MRSGLLGVYQVHPASRAQSCPQRLSVITEPIPPSTMVPISETAAVQYGVIVAPCGC